MPHMHLEEALHDVDRLMVEAAVSDVPVLADASRHIIAAGGKRMRPRLLFLVYQAVGGVDLARAIPVATAIELVHTATLVHDDINDHGQFRRGRVTINEKWGRTFALLTGDFMFTKVYSLMAPYGVLNETLAEATVALVEGETLQAWAAKENQLNRDIYQKIVAKKTASLFRAAAMLGAQLGDAPKSQVEAFGEYGFYLGLAFQIVDDLLDLTGDPALVGKDVGIDVAQGKGVASAVHMGDNGEGTSSDMTVAVATLESPDPFMDIKRRLIAEGAVEEGRMMARMLAAQANATLDRVPPSEPVNELRALVNLAVNRDH